MASKTVNGVGYKIITARYASTCQECGVRVERGERILWAPGLKGVRHAECRDSVVAVRELQSKGLAEVASLTAVCNDWMLEHGYCPFCRGAGLVYKQINFSDTLDYSDWREELVTCPAHRPEGDRGYEWGGSDGRCVIVHNSPSTCKGGAVPARFIELAKALQAQYRLASLPEWCHARRMVLAREGSFWDNPSHEEAMVIEASTLGLAPGEWPNVILLQTREHGLLHFERGHHRAIGTETISFNYQTYNGLRLDVLND